MINHNIKIFKAKFQREAIRKFWMVWHSEQHDKIPHHVTPSHPEHESFLPMAVTSEQCRGGMRMENTERITLVLGGNDAEHAGKSPGSIDSVLPIALSGHGESCLMDKVHTSQFTGHLLNIRCSAFTCSLNPYTKSQNRCHYQNCLWQTTYRKAFRSITIVLTLWGTKWFELFIKVFAIIRKTIFLHCLSHFGWALDFKLPDFFKQFQTTGY